MQANIIYILFYFLSVISPAHESIATSSEKPSEYQELYNEMNLQGIVNYQAFEQAIMGYNKLDPKRKDIITLIDFTKPSTEERLYVINLKEKKLLYTTHVAHGKNSGNNYATSFSNKVGSNQSSLGFFITENTYEGGNGYSLVIDGVEKGINDKAKQRAVVIHGAAYANPSVISSSGRLGRSLGCPALPQEYTKPIIDLIKDGTLLFIYANNENYRQKSLILSDRQV